MEGPLDRSNNTDRHNSYNAGSVTTFGKWKDTVGILLRPTVDRRYKNFGISCQQRGKNGNGNYLKVLPFCHKRLISGGDTINVSVTYQVSPTCGQNHGTTR